MNAIQFAFASAIGNKTIKTAKTLRKTNPLRRRQLAARLGAAGAPLDNATLERISKAAPVAVTVAVTVMGQLRVRAEVVTFAGMVRV